MITPLDIENKKFSKQMMNGYNVEDVDEFLDELVEDYGKNYKELAEMNSKVEELNNSLEHYKNIEISQDESEIISDFNVDKVIEQKEMNDCITKNLKAIGNLEYEIFKKFYYEGKKVKQIAKEMHMTNSNVKTKLHRTRKKIKEILKVGGF